ncbi:amino acid permease [Carboxydothermus pertinax]|uniref:Amino acid permease n=1 Tax=Carboxydothermus pertinax TaxID=870242 RepID=A0A1L8CVH1_9THEO|nr:amino acid permease [Carboxydothermus pertinax]GAV22903.1 amino acid permease [Carboxydothermus pertinax]
MDIFRKKTIEQAKELAEEEKYRLNRALGPWELLLLVLGATIGAGIFVLPGVTAAKHAGPGVIVSFLIGGIISIAVGLAYVEFASLVPVAGSAYTYSYVALGEIIAWIVGWDLLFEFTVVTSTVSVGWGGYVTSLLKSIGINIPTAFSQDIAHGGIVNIPAIIGILIVASIALSGIKAVGRSNALFTGAKVLAIIVFLAIGIFHIKPENWHPFTPFGWGGVLTGAALTFFAYTGFDGVTTVLEEVKDPQKSIPFALIGGIGAITFLYIAVSTVLTGMVSFTKLDVPDPAAFALQQVGVQWGGAMISVAVIFGLIATMLGNGLSSTRILFAMSRDGLLPEKFATVHPKTRVPIVSSIIIFGTALILGGVLSIGELAELANIGGLTAFALTTLSVMVMRYTKPDAKRLFRVPAIWIIGPIGILGSLALIISLPKITIIRFIVWLIIGLIIYLGYGNKHARIKNLEQTAKN